MESMFFHDLTGMGYIDMDMLEKLYCRLPKEYCDSFIEYFKYELYYYGNVDGIALFYTFVFDKVKDICFEETHVDINNLIKIYENYLDTSYDYEYENKDKLIELIYKYKLNEKYEIIDLFLKLLDGE